MSWRAFRDYERIVALENAFRKRSKGELTPEDRDALAVALYAARADYNLGARAHPEATLNDTRSDLHRPTGIAWRRARASCSCTICGTIWERRSSPT